LENRNDLLASRFYYYFSILELRFEACIQNLSNDFFLGENSIEQILIKRKDLVRQLKEKNADLRYLQKQYPSWQWKPLKAV